MLNYFYATKLHQLFKMSLSQKEVYQNSYLRDYIYSFVYLGKKIRNGNNDHTSFFGKKMYFEQGNRIEQIELNTINYLAEWIPNGKDVVKTVAFKKQFQMFLNNVYLYPLGWVVKSPSPILCFFAQTSYTYVIPPFIKFLDDCSEAKKNRKKKK